MPSTIPHLSQAFALAAVAPATRLSRFDLGIVVVYLIAITLFGLRFRERKNGVKADKSLKSYFLANNTIPWWAIALSIVSAETSTLTIISIPGVAFAGNFGFLQLVIGYMLGRIVVAVLFLPRYFAGEMLTAYQLIDRRFGSVLHKVTAGLFLLTRAAAEGVRVFAVSIVVGIAIGTRDVLSIAIISALTLLYTFEGGMTAVIWTDVVQMFIYVAGTVVAITTLGSHIPGGWHTIHTVAGAAGKFHMLDFTLNLTSTYTFWAGVLGGTFLTMASHGTDQLMVQRMLAARNLRESRLALLSSGVVIFIQFTLFLLIGVGLYVFYGQHPTAFASSDRIFPTFIVHEMPIGVAGLLVAAILAAAMSNLSAALNSLSSTTVVDFYMHLRPQADDRERGIVSKSSTVLWALVLFAIAAATVKVGGKGHVVEIGLSIASVAYGCLLGVFLLGTLTRYATQWGTTVGMVCGFALNLWLWQGVFPVHLASLTIPKVAYPWYTIIGSGVTFVIGSIFSLIFRKQSRRIPAISALLLFTVILSGAIAPSAIAQSKDPETHKRTTPARPTSTAATAPDFTQVSQLINDAIAAHKLPGAVVLIGHNGQVVFHHAYGNRKLAGEPGLDGKPSPAEPMTEDTIFDMASLTKCLATATAVMQLYEGGKIADFNDPVQKYLPDFNPANDPTRAQVTLRMLLTHTSGEAPDVALKDPWGLAAPDKAEGIHRALTTPLRAAPGSVFTYSDINFILLGALVEMLSGQAEGRYVAQHLFEPLGMSETDYHPGAWERSAWRVFSCSGTTEVFIYGHKKDVHDCNSSTSITWASARVAPTAHDDEGTAATNPDFDHLLRGTVHDPTTRRMGGVAGHAGLFSTAHDVSLYAQALLDKLLYNRGPFPLKQSTLLLMTRPEQPSTNPAEPHRESDKWADTELAAANAAEELSIKAGDKPAEPGLAPHYPAVKGQNLRGFGWDIDTGFSKPRGAIFPIGSFGHTGFTGTSLWMDPASDTYVILLANANHPRGNPPISNLRGEVATAAALALKLGESVELGCVGMCLPDRSTLPVLTGIDVLEASHFSLLAELANHHNYTLRIGLLTNQSGIDTHGRRTIDILAKDMHGMVNTAALTTLFSPEHGIFGKQDTTSIQSETDPATGLHVTSLYGVGDAARRPTHEQLKDLDAVVIDLQDAGVHFWTYEAVLGYFLEASAAEQETYNHRLDIVVLDRPNPVGGLAFSGPVIDANHTAYIAYMPGMPIRHGMTYGELARYFNVQKSLNAPLTVVPMQNWQRADFWQDTGLPWLPPSPNLRTTRAATLYPAIGMLDTTNLSEGRGSTDPDSEPFTFFGAGQPQKDAKTGEQKPVWFNGADVAAYLTDRHIPGVRFESTKVAISEDANHYPFHGQTIEAVRVLCTDPNMLDTPELGIEIMAALHRLYPTQFNLAGAVRIVANDATMEALKRGDDPRTIARSWQPSLDTFKANRQKALLY